MTLTPIPQRDAPKRNGGKKFFLKVNSENCYIITLLFTLSTPLAVLWTCFIAASVPKMTRVCLTQCVMKELDG